MGAGAVGNEEKEQRARTAAEELGLEYSEDLQNIGRQAWERIRAHQGRTAA